MKRARSGKKPIIQCTRVRPTSHRPGAEGTYIVRLSRANGRRLKVRNGAYLKVTYGKASVMARLSVDEKLKDSKTIRIDQTLRTAICLQKIMQDAANDELIYRSDGSGELEHPVVVQRSKFSGPTPLARLVKQQYLVCIVHHAMTEDMETPIARLTTASMEVLGIQPGDKVLLISERRRKAVRCLPLDSSVRLPLDSMREKFTPPCPEDMYKGLSLPWILLDRQTRLDHEIEPWEPILVGRDPRHAVITEFAALAFTLAVGAVGGAIVVDVRLGQVAILAAGFIAVFALIWAKIRSRI